MRLVLALATAAVAACTVGDPPGELPETGEEQSDGDDSDPTVTGGTPRVDLAVDAPALTTELAASARLAITVRGADGFTGSVQLAAAVAAPGGQALDGWTVALEATTLELGASETRTIGATVTTPSENRGLVGTVTVTATSSAGTAVVTSTVTATNQLTVSIGDNSGQCAYPAAAPIRVTVGTKLRFLNTFAAGAITIHSNGGVQGIAHESDPGHGPGTAYEREATAPGMFDWYCHAPGPNLGAANPKFTVVAAQ